MPIVCLCWETRKSTREYELSPDLKNIVRFLELPPTLILPFNFILIPRIFSSGIMPLKKLIKRYLRNLNISLVFQKLILRIMVFSQLENSTASRRAKLRCIKCKDSSKKNLWPSRRSYIFILGIHCL